jgi:hypothetical protein
MSGVDLGAALREQFPAPDGVPTAGPVGAIRPADRVLLTAHRHSLNTGAGEGAAADVTWLDGVLARQPEWTDAGYAAAVEAARGAGMLDGDGLSLLGRVQVRSLMSRFRV